jgi:hypothetical protein
VLSPEEAELQKVGERLGRFVEHGEILHQDARKCLEKVGRGLGLPVRTSRPLITKAVWSGRNAARDGGGVPTEEECRRLVAMVRDALSARRWKSRKEQARMRLIIAALNVAEQAGKLHLNLAVRQWGDEAGRTKGTVGAHHMDLAPWVVPVRFHPNPYFSKRPTEWIIGCPDALALRAAQPVACPLSGVVPDTTDQPRLRIPQRGAITGLDQEIHQRSIYGPLIHTWVHGREDPFTAREVATAVDTTPDTARRHLHRLKHFGFVDRLHPKTLWQWRPGSGDAEALAEVEPVAWRRKGRHIKEQEWFHNHRVFDLETGEILDYRTLDESDPVAVEAFWRACESTKSWR